MKRVLFHALRAICAAGVLAATWTSHADAVFTWMDGSNLFNQPGVFAGAPADLNPGSRQEPGFTEDSSGNLWMFGGFGSDAAGNIGHLGDLWKYTPSTGLWSFVAGSPVRNSPGVHGVIGTAAPGQTPGARYGSVMWSTQDGKIWIFGGEGYDDAGLLGYLNDTMMFDPVSGLWTWIHGSNLRNSAGVPGIGASATPSARRFPLSSEAPNGQFWLYGGYNGAYLADLWRFNPETRLWALVTGTPINSPPVYGTINVPSPTNSPGGRFLTNAWTDALGNFYFFGGFSVAGLRSDLWKYDISTGLWTWINGSNLVNQFGVYGTLGVPAATNQPGARMLMNVWRDGTDTIWMFGGYGRGEAAQGSLSDLWKYNISTNIWTWIKGDKTVDQLGSPGVIGVPSATNLPRGRQGYAAWVDPTTGDFWLFGGNTGVARFNDLWRLVITYTADVAVTLAAPPAVVIGEETTYTITVTNNGPEPATSVTVTQTIAPNLIVIGANPAQGTVISVPGTITWNVGVLNAGASAVATVTVRGLDLGPAASSAQVTTADVDPNSANNVATANLNVVAGEADVAITATAPASITLHGTITYEITATNNGPNASRNLVITQLLPNPSRIESLTVTSGTIVGTTSPLSVIWDLDIFPAGATANATVVITPLAPGNAASTIQTTADTPDPVPANNTVTVNVNVIQGPGPDLAGSMTATPKCKTKKGVLQCKVKINLTVTNPPPATDIAAKSVARFYLSDDNILDAGDLVLGDRNIKKVKVGKTKTSKLNAKVPGGISPTGKFVIAVLDSGGVVAEGNEFNNTIVFGPLP